MNEETQELTMSMFADKYSYQKAIIAAQQAKIDKLEEAIKYLMDNVDIPRYEMEFCGLIDKEGE